MRKESFFISLILCLLSVVSGLYNSLLIDFLQKNAPILEAMTAPGSFLVFMVLWLVVYLVVSAVEKLASALERPAAKESKGKAADDKKGV
jgi:hypothetical protein